MSVRLDRADLAAFEYRLVKRMEELSQQIGAVREREREESFSSTAGEVPDALDASVAIVVFETANAEIRCAHDERRELDEALGRLSVGSYGVCLRCGQPLERARLEAYPAAKRHLPCQDAHERDLKLRRLA